MSRKTSIAREFKEYNIQDDDLNFIYVNSEDSGPIVGLQLEGYEPFVSVKFEPISTSRVIDLRNIESGPEEINFVESYGDGTSHGATWDYLRNSAKQVSEQVNFRKINDPLDRLALELHLDGLINMSSEGSVRHGEGWTVIEGALRQVHTHIMEGNGWQLEAFFQGLGYIANNFAERDRTELPQVA